MKSNIIAFMNSYSHGKSGGDMVFIEIAKRLTQFKWIIVTSELGKKLCKSEGVKGDYLITSHESSFSSVIQTYAKRIIAAFRLDIKIDPHDIFLGTSDFLPDVLPIYFLKKRHNNRWVQHIFHLIPRERTIPYYAQRLSILIIKNSADSVVVDNTLLRDELINMGFNKQKITVNYPGIDTTILKSVKSRPKKSYDAIFMAQLRPSKGIDDLFEIWKLVNKKLPTARLGIIGQGSAKQSQNIDYLGYLEDDEAFLTIKASKIFLFPSHEEGFGIAAVQAQALGLPVVAWKLPVYPEIFSKGMITIELGNIVEFARRVTSLLTDEKSRRKLSHEGLENAQRFDWDKTARKEIDILTRNNHV